MITASCNAATPDTIEVKDASPGGYAYDDHRARCAYQLEAAKVIAGAHLHTRSVIVLGHTGLPSSGCMAPVNGPLSRQISISVAATFALTLEMRSPPQPGSRHKLRMAQRNMLGTSVSS